MDQEGTANGYLAVKTEYWGAFPEAIELRRTDCHQVDSQISGVGEMPVSGCTGG